MKFSQETRDLVDEVLKVYKFSQETRKLYIYICESFVNLDGFSAVRGGNKMDLGTMGSGATKIRLQTTNISKTGDLTLKKNIWEEEIKINNYSHDSGCNCYNNYNH